jgi:hypothetical protein
MSNEIYRKLVDLYAGHELPLALEEEMEQAAILDPELGHEMQSLRATYDALKEEPAPEFTEETRQRILMKIYAKGVDIQTSAPEPRHFQYQLPIQS